MELIPSGALSRQGLRAVPKNLVAPTGGNDLLSTKSCELVLVLTIWAWHLFSGRVVDS